MTTLLRSLRLIALAIWVGSLVFFIFVAGVAFQTLPDTHTAGLVVRGSLLALHRLGLITGLLYLLLTLTLLGTQRDSHPIRAVELILVLLMLSVTAYSQFSVIPRMENDRLALAAQFKTDVDKAPESAPARQNFNRLHGLSVNLEGSVLIAGLLLLCTAPLHGREDFDRFA
jgi:hypothetical protein